MYHSNLSTDLNSVSLIDMLCNFAYWDCYHKVVVLCTPSRLSVTTLDKLTA